LLEPAEVVFRKQCPASVQAAWAGRWSRARSSACRACKRAKER
jgi:hypothetical protein